MTVTVAVEGTRRERERHEDRGHASGAERTDGPRRGKRPRCKPSHSSTECEIIFLDAGLHMDRISALDLWDLVIEVLQSQKSKENVQGDLLRDTSSSKHTTNHVKTPIQCYYFELCKVSYVSSNVKSSQFGAMLYIFEDNEAVIKMIIKGRSPTMRHVSRTHRVALELVVGQNRRGPPKNQIKFDDTRNQQFDT